MRRIYLMLAHSSVVYRTWPAALSMKVDHPLVLEGGEVGSSTGSETHKHLIRVYFAKDTGIDHDLPSSLTGWQCWHV
jgi:hypothetical protein